MKADWRKCYHGASFFIVALPKNWKHFLCFWWIFLWHVKNKWKARETERERVGMRALCKPVFDVPNSCFLLCTLSCALLCTESVLLLLLLCGWLKFSFHFPEAHTNPDFFWVVFGKISLKKHSLRLCTFHSVYRNFHVEFLFSMAICI